MRTVSRSDSRVTIAVRRLGESHKLLQDLGLIAEEQMIADGAGVRLILSIHEEEGKVVHCQWWGGGGQREFVERVRFRFPDGREIDIIHSSDPRLYDGVELVEAK